MVILIAMKRSRMMVNSEATDLRKMKLLRYKKKRNNEEWLGA